MCTTIHDPCTRGVINATTEDDHMLKPQGRIPRQRSDAVTKFAQSAPTKQHLVPRFSAAFEDGRGASVRRP